MNLKTRVKRLEAGPAGAERTLTLEELVLGSFGVEVEPTKVLGPGEVSLEELVVTSRPDGIGELNQVFA